MKLKPVTKFDKEKFAKEKTATSKKFNDDVMSTNCDVIVFFLIYDQFAVIRKPIPDAWPIKLRFSLTITFYLTKIENRTKKYLTELSYYCFE